VVEFARLQVQIENVRLRGRDVLSALEFTCEPGQHTVVLGPNGAGKTTLLRAIVGLIPFAGRIHINQQSLEQMAERERARRIAYVPQRSALVAGLSVLDVVMQGRFAHRSEWGAPQRRDREVVEHAMHMMDITELAQRAFSRLSGGEQRRVLLGRALATEAPVILLDEPSSFLDIAHSLELFQHLAQLRERGHTLVSVLHDLREAERCGDQALVLDRGALQYVGAARLPEALVRSVYGVQVLPDTAPSYRLMEPR
jgi:iron complex transport system ATP-binding protein